MRDALSATQYLRESQWRAFGYLAQSELLAEEYWDEGRGARWVLGQKGTFVHRCEIIAGIGGSLIVHGDFSLMRFAHYGDHADAFSRLCWMGLCYDVGYYVAQKAAIGMGRTGSTERYHEEVARHDLRELIKDRSEEEDAELRALLTEALGHVESEQQLTGFLYDHARGRWDLWEYSFGRALDSHVVVAHVALNRTACLLLERHGSQGPPACRQVRVASPRKEGAVAADAV